jgi:hypothetical protein
MMLLVLCLDKFIDSFFLNEVQIVLHAHSVILFISVVDAINLLARILIAFKTKHGSTAFCRVIDSATFPEQMRAPLISRSTAGALASF